MFAREMFRSIFSQYLQCNDVFFIIIQCALVRFSILLILWIMFISCFKTSFRLYVLFIVCKSYSNAKSMNSQNECEIVEILISMRKFHNLIKFNFNSKNQCAIFFLKKISNKFVVSYIIVDIISLLFNYWFQNIEQKNLFEHMIYIRDDVSIAHYVNIFVFKIVFFSKFVSSIFET